MSFPGGDTAPHTASHTTSEPAPAAAGAASPVRTVLRPGAVITQADWAADREVRSLHVICIGGAGMSAVARLALEAGYTVSGSDPLEGQFIAPLREAGAQIHIGFDANAMPADVDLVVVSTAVRPDNPEVQRAQAEGIPVVHRAAVLAGLLREHTLLAVAGTHGKTSTTAMAAMALRGAGEDPAWAVGAAVPDLGRNAGFGAVAMGKRADGAGTSALAVVEADESDGSFLAFHPRALVVTNQEPDHLDFHGDAATLQAAFDALVDQLAPGGTLVVCADDPGAAALGARCNRDDVSVATYGTGHGCTWQIVAEEPAADGTTAQLNTPQGPLTLQLAVGGHHNVLNAVGALAAAHAVLPQAPLAALGEGVSRFHGASRRCDVAGTVQGVTVVDDYAHHPREVEATILAARGIAQARGGRVLAVFQPHLFSRTRDFAAEFAQALSTADRSWVMPVYAAREDPDPSVSAHTITSQAGPGRTLIALEDRTEVPQVVAETAQMGDLVLMLGAGDIVEDTPAVLAALEGADIPAERENAS